MKNFLSVKETAVLLDIHEVSVRRLINRGKVKAKKIGGKLFVDPASLGLKKNDSVETVLSYGERLRRGEAKIGVWGVGYIGFSTLVYFASEGVEGEGFDIDLKRVEGANRGEADIPGLDEWLNVPVKHLIFHKLMSVTADDQELLSAQPLVHFVCIPTEKEGEPWLGPLKDVVGKIAGYLQKHADYKPLIIVESTLTPGASDDVVLKLFSEKGLKPGEDFLYAVAPRRDWFVDPQHTLKTLDRVFGGYDKESGQQTKSVLSIVCEKLHQSSDYRVAEMVKSVENAYRHMDITLANQLTLAYPNSSIREVLRLVGTKWNAGTFYPSFGTGGYCIPLSSKYVISGAKNPQALTLLRETIATDKSMPKRVVMALQKRKIRSVGILGLSYKGNLKVPHQSPAIGIAKELKKRGMTVRVNDPYYDDKEIKLLTGCKSFDFPNELSKFEALVLVADHALYTMPGTLKHLEKSKVRVIYDNVGFWKNLTFFNERGIDYYIPGDDNWLK